MTERYTRFLPFSLHSVHLYSLVVFPHFAFKKVDMDVAIFSIN